MPRWGWLWNGMLIQGALCSWHLSKHLAGHPEASLAVHMFWLSCLFLENRECISPPPLPIDCTPADIYTGWLLETTFLGGIVCRALCSLPWSQEKIYILLSLFNRSQSFPLLSRRFQMNINLTPALTDSSHLFTKINFKHTLKNNS